MVYVGLMYVPRVHFHVMCATCTNHGEVPRSKSSCTSQSVILSYGTWENRNFRPFSHAYGLNSCVQSLMELLAAVGNFRAVH